jgi:hypothetical protein
MRNASFIAVIFLVGLPAWPQSAKAVLGSWEGESKCAVRDSGCQDQQVLYQITGDRKDPFQLDLDTYKIVEGSPDFMGTLACHYQTRAAVLSCTSSSKEKDDWEFHVAGDTMSGRLLMEDGKTLYRRLALHRAPK